MYIFPLTQYYLQNVNHSKYLYNDRDIEFKATVREIVNKTKKHGRLQRDASSMGARTVH